MLLRAPLYFSFANINTLFLNCIKNLTQICSVHIANIRCRRQPSSPTISPIWFNFTYFNPHYPMTHLLIF